MKTADKINDKAVVKDYFNQQGFDRWRRIYGETEDVNKVQKDIRIGHQQTIDTVVEWLTADSNLAGISVCDAGCGGGCGISGVVWCGASGLRHSAFGACAAKLVDENPCACKLHWLRYI